MFILYTINDSDTDSDSISQSHTHTHTYSDSHCHDQTDSDTHSFLHYEFMVIDTILIDADDPSSKSCVEKLQVYCVYKNGSV